MRSINQKIIVPLICAILLFSCKNEEPVEPVVAEKSYKKNCEEYFTFYINENYYLQNNVWGFYAGSYNSSFSQCVFYDTIHPSNLGWEWDLEAVSEYPSYPRVGYGWNPWLSGSTTSDLPTKIKFLNSVVSSFNKGFSTNGKYNTSFDIWLTTSETPNEENISAEIMVWLEANESPNTAVTIENVVVNDEPYSFYKNTEWYTYPFFVFVRKEQTWEGEIDLLSFLKYLVENNHISSEEYLSVIEFGNEIWSGNGKMEIEDYKIEIGFEPI